MVSCLMVELTKTTPELSLGKKKPHYHIIYLNDEAGIGFCAEAADHVHEVMFIPPEMDEETGEEIAPGRFEMLPSEDGHSHGVDVYQARPPKKKETDEKIVRDVYNLFRECTDLEAESVKKAEEAERFYQGKQWSDSQRDELEAVSRSALTINMVGRQIDELSGLQREQRADLHYLPVDEGDQKTADILNIVSKNILEQCFFAREESETFLDQAIAGRGVWNIYVSREKDIRGQIIVERFPWDSFRAGPHEKQDLSDCEYIFKDKMYSYTKLGQLWPAKRSKIQTDLNSRLGANDMYGSSSTGIDSNKAHQQYNDDQYAHTDNWYPANIVSGQTMVDPYRKEYRVMECWRKIYLEASVVTNPDDDFYFNAYGWKAADIKAAATIPGLYVVKRTIPKIRITRVAGSVVLNDDYPADLPVDDFFTIPIYAYKRGNSWWGKIEAAKDPQKEVNKRTSQTVDITNKMASYGWFIDHSTFPDPQAKDQFKRVSTSPGFVVHVSDTGRPPVQVEGTKMPSEIVALMEMAQGRLVDQMNVTVEPSGANESGAHLLQRQKQRLTGNEFMFDNNAFAKKKLGRIMATLIQIYYSPERILNMLRNENTRTPVELGGEPMENFTEEEIVTFINDVDVAKVDVVVEESTFSPTHRLATYQLLNEAVQRGTPIPPQFLIELLDLPAEYKTKLAEGMAAEQDSASSQQSETQMMEENKALIPQGIVPGGVKIRLMEEEEQFQQMKQQREQGGRPEQGPLDLMDDQGNEPLAQ